MNKNTYIKGALLATTGGIFWALSGTFGQFLFERRGFDAEWLTSFRLICAGLIMLIICFMKEGNGIFRIWKTKKDVFEIVLYGILGMAGVQLTYFTAIQLSNAATGTVIQYTGSVFVVLYLAIRALKLPDKSEMVAVFLAVVGIFILSTHGDINNMVVSVEALVWGLSSAVLLAFYTIFPVRMLNKWGTMATNGWGMLLGGIFMAVFIRRPWDIAEGTLDFPAVLAASGVVVFGTILAFFCYMEGVRMVGSSRAVLYASAEPLTSAIIGIIWFKIAFGIFDWIGALMIVAAVFVITLAKKPASESEKL